MLEWSKVEVPLGRPVKWSRDLHSIRERAASSRTEAWSRQDIEKLFNVGRASAQMLMKAIGEVQSVGRAHFVERTSLLSFAEEMLAASSVEAALNTRLLEASPPPSSKPIRVSLPKHLRHIMLRDLPETIRLTPGRVEITGTSAENIVENLALLAQAMQNNFTQIEACLQPVSNTPAVDTELRNLFAELRDKRNV